MGHLLSQGWWTGIGTIATLAALILGWLTYRQGKAEAARSTRGDAVGQILGQGGRTRTGAISTVAVLFLGLLGFLGLLTYHQAPSPVPAGNICSFVVGGTASCDSTDPQVRVYVNFEDDTSGCTFVRDINWGDGTSSGDIVIQGGPAGPRLVDDHTYSASGSYAIFLGGQVTQGACFIQTPTFQFGFLPN